MNSRCYAINGSFDRRTVGQFAGESPLQSFVGTLDLQSLDRSNGTCSPAMPQDGVSEDHTERQVIHQRFQCAHSIGLRKIGMHPAPVASVAVSAVMALYAEAQRFAADFLAVEKNLAGEGGIRMLRARKPDPAFITQLRAKQRVDAQVPGNVMAVGPKISPAAALLNPASRAAAVKRGIAPGAQLQLFNGAIHDETLRRACAGKPHRPNLKMAARRRLRRNLDVVHQQIPEPPSAATVRQAAAHEPDFVAPPHARCGVDSVEFGVVQEDSSW